MAEIAKSVGALTIGVVTRPFQFEGRRRAVQADNGIQRLREKVDTLIVIPNDRLLTVTNEKTSLVNAFKIADEGGLPLMDLKDLQALLSFIASWPL